MVGTTVVYMPPYYASLDTPCTYHAAAVYPDAAGAPTRAAVRGRVAQAGRKAWVRGLCAPPGVKSVNIPMLFSRRSFRSSWVILSKIG